MELREIPLPDAEQFLKRYTNNFKSVPTSKWALGLFTHGQLTAVVVVGETSGPPSPGDKPGKQGVHHMHMIAKHADGKIEMGLFFNALQIAADEKGVPQLSIPTMMTPGGITVGE